jgi:hypothetical protein
MATFNSGYADGDDTALKGGTDGTIIGNVGDALKTTATITGMPFATNTIDFPHYMIHIGRAYKLDHVYTLSSGANHDHAFVTPSSGTRYPHLTWLINSSDDLTIYLYEAPTLTLGSEIAAYNRNRNSANANTTKVYSVDAVSNVGTEIEANRIGMGSGSHQNQNVGNSLGEWIFKANTTYLWRVKSNANGNIISASIEWYEYDYTQAGG